MTRNVLACIACGALALGCSRDLTVPKVSVLDVSPAFTSLAPRESVTLAASGGAGEYRFAFALGGKLSGSDATVDPVTGTYVAGSAGSAQDIIEVTDSTGTQATALVTVGPRVAISPVLAGATPGATVVFVGSGGKPPYTFAFAAGGNVSGGTIDPTSGMYQAGPAGDVSDIVVITDATGDVLARASATVRVSSALSLYRGSSGDVAPHDSVTFAAFGGQPLYTFGFAPGGNLSGGNIVSNSGVYTAGGTGDVLDTIQVTDANSQVATSQVRVGAVLQLAPIATAIRPGLTARLIATGGKLPYTYGFATNGNRSLGRVEAQTGDYTPGPNVGAADIVNVVDATGTEATLAPGAVGPRQIHPGTGVQRCVAADLNGDGRRDALLLAYDPTGIFLQATTFAFPRGAGAVEQLVYMPSGRALDQVLVGDFNASGREQLASFGRYGFWTLIPDAAGNLVFGPELPWSSFWTTQPPAFNHGTPFALARGATMNRFYTAAKCPLGAPATGILRVDWPYGASSPNAPTCVPLTTTAAPIFAMAAGDLNGDGIPDLAWVTNPSSNSSPGPVYVAYGDGSGGFTNAGAPAQFAFPIASAFYTDPWWWGNPETSFLMVPAGLFIMVTAPAGYPQVVFLRGGTPGAPAWAVSGFPLVPPGGYDIWGIGARSAAGDQLAAWSFQTGTVEGFDLTGSPSWSPIASVGNAIQCAIFPDVNGDGAPDLVVGASASSTADVLWGDGNGGFGQRARFGNLTAWAPAGDVNGDGIGDVVGATGSPGLRVLFGVNHQLAYGPETLLATPATLVTAGDLFGNGGRAVAWFDQSQKIYRSPILANGSLGAASLLIGFGASSLRPTRLFPFDGGGTGPGKDLFVVLRQGDATFGFSYFVYVAKRNGTSDYAGFLWQARACDFLPVGANDVFALCTKDSNNLTLYRSTRGTPWSDFVETTDATLLTALAGTGGARASTADAGVLSDGTGIFLGAASTPSGNVAVKVLSLQVASGILTWKITALASPTSPLGGAALGFLDSAITPGIAVLSGGQVTVLKRDATKPTDASAYVPISAPSATGAPGAIGGIVPLASGTNGDVLMFTGEEIVPLKNDGTGHLN